MTKSANTPEPIHRDDERVETEAVERLKAELARAFGAPDTAYQPLDADAVIKRNALDRP